MRKPVAAVLVAAFSLAGLGCGGDDAPSGPTGGSSFSADIQPIFTANCTASGCHGTPSSQGLTLTTGNSYADLVNVPSEQVPSQMRVLPGDPGNSYLMVKLGDNPPQGLQMPRGQAPLSDDDVSSIRQWIEDGAEND